MTTAEYGLKFLLKKRNHQILLYAAGPNIATIPQLSESRGCPISGIIPERLTFRDRGSMKLVNDHP
jgi:hypothetical protein